MLQATILKVYQASVNVRSGQHFMDLLALLYSSLRGRWAAPSGISVGASRVRWKSLEKPRKTEVALLTLTLD